MCTQINDKFNKNWEDDQIDNQPGITLKDTGHYHINHYGCWHKVEVIKADRNNTNNHIVGEKFYIIGEYPQSLYLWAKP